MAALEEPEPEPEPGETSDVAALMGFASFGDQHRGKRRRYDARTEEAVVDDGGLSTPLNGKGRGEGSGSNNLPLGAPKSERRLGRKTSGAIGSDGPDKGNGNDTDTVWRRTGHWHSGAGEDEGTATESTSNAVVSERAAAPLPSATTRSMDPGLPPKPPPPSRVPTLGGKRAGNEAWELRRGVRLASGDVAYYDASFVENPWRELLP